MGTAPQSAIEKKSFGHKGTRAKDFFIIDNIYRISHSKHNKIPCKDHTVPSASRSHTNHPGRPSQRGAEMGPSCRRLAASGARSSQKKRHKGPGGDYATDSARQRQCQLAWGCGPAVCPPRRFERFDTQPHPSFFLTLFTPMLISSMVLSAPTANSCLPRPEWLWDTRQSLVLVIYSRG